MFYKAFLRSEFGKNYDAAVLSAGHCGFAMGATPTAVANMSELDQSISDQVFDLSYLILSYTLDVFHRSFFTYIQVIGLSDSIKSQIQYFYFYFINVHQERLKVFIWPLKLIKISAIRLDIFIKSLYFKKHS